MPPSDDAAAQRELNATLERFRGDARVALGLRPTDDAVAARKSFLALCKLYHPAKFARFAPPTVKLSNEVFLAIRRAYDSVAAAPQHAPGRAPVPAAAPAPPGAPERPSGTIPRIVKFTPPAGIPVMPPVTPPTPTPHPPTPVRPAAQERPTGGMPRAATPRPLTPSPSPPSPSPPIAGPARAATPSPAPARAATDVQLERALDLAQQQKWPEARTAFVELATRHPGDPRYRAYVHYARGWEAFALGRDSEARAEWQRALAFDPRNDLVKWALESTGVVK